MSQPANPLAESLRIKREFFQRHHDAIHTQAVLLAATLKRGGKLISFGNGGSAADSKRITEVLLRKGHAAIALPALFTPDGSSFASLYQALRRPGDCALAISTSGNSTNVLEAVEAAQAAKDPVIAFTGNSGGKLRGLVAGALVVGDDRTQLPTARIQEVHLMLVHELCSIAFSIANG
jgi:D-sedoheptulose 7-phosphate isomerase